MRTLTWMLLGLVAISLAGCPPTTNITTPSCFADAAANADGGAGGSGNPDGTGGAGGPGSASAKAGSGCGSGKVAVE